MNCRQRSFLSSLMVWLSLGLPGDVLALAAEDVVRLHASGFREEEILEVLAATQSEFMLSARDLVYLSRSGVSDAVVQNMLVALPLQPVAGADPRDAEPLRLMFTREDLDLLVQNQVSEPVMVTFIDTRDMAFTLDVGVLTALRQSGLGLDALQLLVEKSAAGLPVPMALPPVYASTTGSSGGAYLFGRSGYGSYHDIDYSPIPYATFYTSTIYPWHWGFSGYRPFYATYFPAWGWGYRWHSFYCPRGRHHHGHGHDGYADSGRWDGKHHWNGHGRWPGDGRDDNDKRRIYFGTGGRTQVRDGNGFTGDGNRDGRNVPVVVRGSQGNVPRGEPSVATWKAQPAGTGSANAGTRGTARAMGSALFAPPPGTSPGPITKSVNPGKDSGALAPVPATDRRASGAHLIRSTTATWQGVRTVSTRSQPAAATTTYTATTNGTPSPTGSLATAAGDGGSGGRTAFRSRGSTSAGRPDPTGRWGQWR
jgi:hypothetical protein